MIWALTVLINYISTVQLYQDLVALVVDEFFENIGWLFSWSLKSVFLHWRLKFKIRSWRHQQNLVRQLQFTPKGADSSNARDGVKFHCNPNSRSWLRLQLSYSNIFFCPVLKKVLKDFSFLKLSVFLVFKWMKLN